MSQTCFGVWNMKSRLDMYRLAPKNINLGLSYNISMNY